MKKIMIIALAAALASCNSTAHMMKIHPSGTYWSFGKLHKIEHKEVASDTTYTVKK